MRRVAQDPRHTHTHTKLPGHCSQALRALGVAFASRVGTARALLHAEERMDRREQHRAAAAIHPRGHFLRRSTTRWMSAQVRRRAMCCIETIIDNKTPMPWSAQANSCSAGTSRCFNNARRAHESPGTSLQVAPRPRPCTRAALHVTHMSRQRATLPQARNTQGPTISQQSEHLRGAAKRSADKHRDEQQACPYCPETIADAKQHDVGSVLLRNLRRSSLCDTSRVAPHANNMSP